LKVILARRAGKYLFQGQLVRVLIDDAAGRGTWFSSFERGGSIDVRITRDDNGNITGLEVIEI
jgi:hypothetical protein